MVQKINVSLGNSPRLSQTEFRQMAHLVYKHCGIHLADSKKVMLESRLSKRLRTLQIVSFRDYISLLETRDGLEKELVQMIDVVTTNKTDFFREPHHFEFLTNTVVPEFVQRSNGRPFKVWSAACSSGEEPYTLAMVLNDFAAGSPKFNYAITASDISTHVLEKAAHAVYSTERVADIPLAVKQRYLLRSKNRENPTVRVVGALREKVKFSRVNLMHDDLNVEGDFDVIFCRNVLIYFDRKTQYEVVLRLAGKLRPGGYLFIGHSESLHAFDLPLRQCRPTIFQKI